MALSPEPVGEVVELGIDDFSLTWQELFLGQKRSHRGRKTKVLFALWTTIFTQVLLFLSLLSYLLLGGLILPPLFSGPGFATMLAVWVWALATLLCVLLCVVSGMAYAHARQWHQGKQLATWGLAGGILGVFLVLGAVILFLSDMTLT